MLRSCCVVVLYFERTASKAGRNRQATCNNSAARQAQHTTNVTMSKPSAAQPRCRAQWRCLCQQPSTRAPTPGSGILGMRSRALLRPGLWTPGVRPPALTDRVRGFAWLFVWEDNPQGPPVWDFPARRKCFLKMKCGAQNETHESHACLLDQAHGLQDAVTELF